MRARPCLALALAAALAAPVAAQTFSPLSIAVDANQLTVSRSAAGGAVLDGNVLGATVGFRYRRLSLEGRYAEGKLSPTVTALSPQDYVATRLIAHVRILPGFSLGAGPHLRAFVTPSGTARWTRMEVHGRGEGELIGGIATLRVDAWLAPSAQYEPGGGKNAMGGEASMLLRIPGTPAALQLGYVADRARLADDEDEVVESLRVSLVLDRIQRSRPPQR